MVQLGDFGFAQNRSTFTLDRAMLLGWVTNNYWETNLPCVSAGHGDGALSYPAVCGDFDEARAQRFAAEAAHARPLVQHMGEPTAAPQLPAAGTLLHLPQPPVLTLGLRADQEHGGLLLTLFNASDEAQVAVIAPALITIQQARVCDLHGEPGEVLDVANKIEVPLAPRRMVRLNLTVV